MTGAKATTLNWNTTGEESRNILAIASRAAANKPELDELEVAMDITAVHLNDPAVNIDLDRLLNFDKFNFMHDILGINRHIDRQSGQLSNCFLPRCARGN